jgi:hypothetical protein
MDFPIRGVPVRRGVVSYYAAATLTEATTLHSWLRLIERTSQEDAAKGALTAFHQPILQIDGDGSLPLIGKPMADGSPRDGLSTGLAISRT